MNGYSWIIFSITLISAAQLLLKWSMMHLPPLNSILFMIDIINNKKELLFLVIGLLTYVFSMGCWFMALRQLPLTKAYPLVSISYVIVAICAVIIPEFNEKITLSRIIGILLICIGILLIYTSASNNNKQKKSS